MAAEVIPFPNGVTLPVAPDPDDRLARALQGLEQALAEQRAAIAEWRASLRLLQGTMRGVGEGLQRYRGTLDQLRGDVMAVNGQAVQLEQWADCVLANEAAPHQ